MRSIYPILSPSETPRYFHEDTAGRKRTSIIGNPIIIEAYGNNNANNSGNYSQGRKTALARRLPGTVILTAIDSRSVA